MVVVVPAETATLLDRISIIPPKLVLPIPDKLSLILYERVVTSKSLILNFVG